MRARLLAVAVLAGCAGDPSSPSPEPARPVVGGCSVREGAGWVLLGGPGSTPTHLAVAEGLAIAAVDSRLFSSRDGGLTWSRVPGPKAETKVTATATRGSEVFLGTDDGVVTTTDGLTWGSLGGVVRPDFLSVDAQGLFAGSVFGLLRFEGGAWSPVPGPSGVAFDKALLVDGALLANAGSGLYRRTDGWIRPSGTEPWGYEDLVARGRQVWVARAFGVLSSEDAGLTFAPLVREGGVALDNVVGLTHVGERVLVATRRGLFGGPARGPVALLDARPVTALAAGPGLVLASSAAGLRRSTDGLDWADAGAIAATRPSFVVAVEGALLTDDGERALRSEDGKVWSASALGGASLRLAHVAVQGSQVLAVAGLPGAGAINLVRSVDGGRTFERVGVPNLPWSRAAVSALAFDGDRILVATRSGADGGLGVRLSEDGGRTFPARNTGLPASLRPDAPWLPSTVAYLRGDVALVGVPGQGLYRNDAAAGWQRVHTLVPKAILDAPPGAALALVVADDGVVHRLDAARGLVPVGAPLGRSVQAATIVGGLLVVALDDGSVLASADLGATWRALGGPSPSPARALTGHHGRVVIATDGAALATVDLACAAGVP